MSIKYRLIINNSEQGSIVTSNHLPRVGDELDLSDKDLLGYSVIRVAHRLNSREGGKKYDASVTIPFVFVKSPKS